MRGIYPIVDLEVCAELDLDPLELTVALLPAKPPLLQLRAKRAAPRVVLAVLRGLRDVLTGSGTRLIANDRPDLAVIAGCDGVHLGQEDIPLQAARRFAPSLVFGCSTHSLEQLQQALLDKPDYVAFGPVFPTRTKSDASAVVGTRRLAEAARLARAAGIPLVGIGGLTSDNVDEVASDLDLASVISAVHVRDPSRVTSIACQIQAKLTRSS